MKILLAVILFVSSIYEINAQETIWLLNGEKITASKYSIDSENRMFYYQNLKGKTKDIELDFIFSTVDSLGNEVVIYTPDTVDEEGSFLYSEKEMRQYIEGAIEARKNYKGLIAFGTGFLTGVAAPFIPAPPFVNALFLVPVYPAVNTTIIGATNPSEEKFFEKYPNQQENIPFKEGYLDIAREKRVRKSIYGGLSGILIGITTAIIIDSI